MKKAAMSLKFASLEIDICTLVCKYSIGSLDGVYLTEYFPKEVIVFSKLRFSIGCGWKRKVKNLNRWSQRLTQTH